MLSIHDLSTRGRPELHRPVVTLDSWLRAHHRGELFGHDDHELIVNIDVIWCYLMALVCNYILFLEDLLFIHNVFVCFCHIWIHFVWSLCVFFACFSSIQYSNSSLHSNPSVATMTLHFYWVFSDTAVQSTYPCHGGNKAVSCESQLACDPFDESMRFHLKQCKGK